MTETIRFALEWIPNTNHTGFYAALSNGYYKAQNLDVQIFMPDNHGDGRAWLLNNQTDLAITEQMSLSDIFIKDAHAPLTAISAMTDHNLSGLLTNETINRPADLSSHVYASFGYPTEKLIIRDTVNADGGDFKQTKLVGNDMIFDPIKDLAEHRYDAIFVYHQWEGLMAKLSQQPEKYHFYYVNKYVSAFDYYTPVIAANRNYLAHHSDAVRRFLKATAQGFNYARLFPDEAAKILMRYVPDRRLQEELVCLSQNEISQHYAFTEDKPFGYIDRERWQAFYQWLNETKNLTLPTDLGFTNDFLPM